jgi:7-carboxy-7-deazaguanine synthase
MTIRVNEIFGPTFQGEGPSMGQRAFFIRLAGCNLNCSWCDTPYSWDWSRYDHAAETHAMETHEVVTPVLKTDVALTVITGGEPLLQQRSGLKEVLQALREPRYMSVEIETNGTVMPRGLGLLVNRFNVSPKLANSGIPEHKRIRPDVLEEFRRFQPSVFKFVIEDEHDLDEVDDIVGANKLPHDRVWCMPQGITAAEVAWKFRVLADAVIAHRYHFTPRLQVLAWEGQRGV